MINLLGFSRTRAHNAGARRRHYLALLALIGAGTHIGAAHADAQGAASEQTDQQALAKAGVLPPGGFIYSTHPDYWRFLMGPVQSLSESLMLYHDPSPQDGGLSLACKRYGGDDTDVMVIAPIAPVAAPTGTSVLVTLTVDGMTHTQTMYVTKAGAGLISPGPAPVAILDRLSALPAGTTSTITATFDGETVLNVKVPADHTTIADVAEICHSWAVAP
jgi:hypothetical protein